MRSQAPEYGGASQLPTTRDPETLAALGADEPRAADAATPGSASADTIVSRLPGTPELQPDGKYWFAGGGLELAVDPKLSGRVVRLSLEGKDVLASAELSPSAFGATFRLSPQSDWSGAVPSAIDGKPYAAEVQGSVLLLRSEVTPELGLAITKQYRLDTARRCVEVTYTLQNQGSVPRKVAPSEGHRVPAAGGLSFYPSGQKLYPRSTLRLNAWSPVTWFAHDLNRETKPVESFADGGGGWLAYTSAGVLFVKSFADVAEGAQAPGEGEIEIYADYDAKTRQHRFVQLEQQGAYTEIRPGSSSSWSVRWFVRRLPEGITAKPGNQELVGFVRGVIQ